MHPIKKDFFIDKLLLNEHGGMGSNFNKGLEACHGCFIIYVKYNDTDRVLCFTQDTNRVDLWI